MNKNADSNTLADRYGKVVDAYRAGKNSKQIEDISRITINRLEQILEQGAKSNSSKEFLDIVQCKKENIMQRIGYDRTI